MDLKGFEEDLKGFEENLKDFGVSIFELNSNSSIENLKKLVENDERSDVQRNSSTD